MRVKLAYGRAGMTVNMPDNRTSIIEPLFMPSIPDEAASIQHALNHPIRSRPLREVISAEDSVAIVFCDITRPMPNALVLPLVLEHLQHVPRKKIGDRSRATSVRHVHQLNAGQRHQLCGAEMVRRSNTG